jgi:hypothetical protein
MLGPPLNIVSSLPEEHACVLNIRKVYSKGTTEKPSLDFSASDCEALLTMLDDDRCHIASPVPRIYGTIWGLPDLPKFWFISPPF